MPEIRYVAEDEYSIQSHILALAEEAFGPNYLKPAHFKPPFYYTFLVAEEDGLVIGFACCSVSQGLGCVDDVVVSEKHKGKGLGTALVSHCLAHLWQMGALTVESNAWEYIDTKKVPLASALEANGFERVNYLPEFYHHPESDYVCVLCGHPCHCSAFLYRRSLDNTPPKLIGP